jgi:hypothetical protein
MMGFTKMYDSDADVYKGVHDPGLTVATDRSRLATPAGATGVRWTIFSGNNKNGFGPNDRRNVTRVTNPDRPGFNMLHLTMQRREPAGGYNPGLPLSGGVYPWHGTRGGVYGLPGMSRNFMLEMLVRVSLGSYTKNALMSWPVDGNLGATYNELDWEEIYADTVMGANGNTTIWYVKNGAKQHSPVSWNRPPSGWQSQWRLHRCVRLSTGIKQWVGNADGTNMVLVYDSTTKSYNDILNASNKLMTYQPFSFALAQYNLGAHDIYNSGGAPDKSGYMDLSRVRLSNATLDTTWTQVPTGAIDDTGTPGQPQNVPSTPANVAAEASSTSGVHLHWDAAVSNGASPLAGYRVQRASVTGGLGGSVGTWSTINGGNLVVNQQFDDSGLAANTVYAYRVAAMNANGLISAAYSSVVQVQTFTTAPGTPAPVAYLIVTSNDGLDTSEAGQLIEDAPFNALLDPRNSTGTVNNVIITSSFNGGTATSLYNGAMPTDPLSQQFTDPGSYEIVLTAKDTATNRTSVTRLTLVINDPQEENELLSPNLRLPYPVYDPANPQQLSAAWARQLIDALDSLPTLMALRFTELNDTDGPGMVLKYPDEDYGRLAFAPSGIYFGDGIVDLMSTTPQTAPATTTTPPVVNVTVDYVGSSENENTASANPTIVLPAGIPAGSYAVVGVISKLTYADLTPPAGWTVLAQGKHLNGSTKFHVIGKPVGTADSSTTVTITQGSSIWISEAYIAKGTIIYDDVDIFIPTSSSAAGSFPAPVIQTAYSNELILAIWAGRGTQNAALNIIAPSSMTTRQQEQVGGTTTTNMAMTMADQRQATPSSSVTVDNASSGQNAFAMCVLVAFKPTTP